MIKCQSIALIGRKAASPVWPCLPTHGLWGQGSALLCCRFCYCHSSCLLNRVPLTASPLRSTRSATTCLCPAACRRHIPIKINALLHDIGQHFVWEMTSTVSLVEEHLTSTCEYHQYTQRLNDKWFVHVEWHWTYKFGRCQRRHRQDFEHFVACRGIVSGKSWLIQTGIKNKFIREKAQSA